jgi:hypothetical protein
VNEEEKGWKRPRIATMATGDEEEAAGAKGGFTCEW